MTSGDKGGTCLVVTPGTTQRGRRPNCPHCGRRKVEVVNPNASSRDGFISAQAMRCTSDGCGREFWQFKDPSTLK